MKFIKSGEKGFTLIELLVVISILGVLAAVVVLNVTKYVGAGKDQAAATELANVQTAIAAYMYDQASSAFPAGDYSGAGGMLSPYFLNSLHGTYTVDATGHITASTYQ